MAVKYYCDSCGEETNTPEEYMETQIILSFYSQRQYNLFNHGLSGQKQSQYSQCLCDECKKKILKECDEFMKNLRKNYSKAVDNPSCNWDFDLAEEQNNHN